MQNSLEKRLTALEAHHAPSVINGEYLYNTNAKLWQSGRLVNDSDTVKAVQVSDIEAQDWARAMNIAEAELTEWESENGQTIRLE